MSLTLPNDRCFVIAEAGTNHADDDPNKRLHLAMDYVAAAADCGADAVKCQWFDAGHPQYEPPPPLFCPLPGDENRWWRWSASTLPLSAWYRVKQYAESKDLVFLASTFQHSTVAWLNELGVVATKVASRAAKTFPYDSAPEPYLISTGFLEDGWKCPAAHPKSDPYWLECEARYPSKRKWSGMAHGFSDHSGTPWRAIDAISRGCKLIEVHFHIDERDAGPDLPASLTLDELKLVCEARDAFAELWKQ